jgi:selenocysteine-specific elongation factor
MRRLVLGTAGHIDHGKTALVRALTGTDTDRLPEEKQRGITIDLGFARLDGAGEAEVAIVDVPGHEHFIRNMLAGASGIDFVLVVVAADEGVMPQTREHVAIAELLGMRHAVVALTKTDLVDEAWLELARDDVRTYLDGTGFAGAPVVAVSAVDGSGLDELRAALADGLARVVTRNDEDAFRLPVDRVFTVKGTGTVVTGSVWSGRATNDATLRLLPVGRTVRVRGLQRHGEPVGEVSAGTRAALALAGIDRDDARRGDVLVDDAPWPVVRRITARLRVIRDTDWEIGQRQRVRLHLGTAEVMARVVLLDRPHLAAGQSGWAQLRLERPLVARAGDRFVLRSYSPVTTIGGGHVVELAEKQAGAGAGAYLDTLLAGSVADAVVARVTAAGLAGIDRRRLPFEVVATATTVADTLPALDDVVVVGERVFAVVVLADLASRFREAVAAHHAAQPLQPGMPVAALRAVGRSADAGVVEHVLDELVRDGRLRRDGQYVAEASFRPTLTEEQEHVRKRLLATFEQAGLTPPARAELPADVGRRPDLDALLAMLQADGALVALKPDLFFARSALAHAADQVRRRLAGRDGLGPADFRPVLPVSRKYLIPLLEHLDATGVTVRRGDARSVPGT